MKPKKRKIYHVTYFSKHYVHKRVIAESEEEAVSLAWAICPKDCWVEKVEL